MEQEVATGIPFTLASEITAQDAHWLITGVAGFIGSNLLETLLFLDQKVRGLDNFATGHPHNLREVRLNVGEERWSRFEFIEGDVCKLSDCEHALIGIDYVLHQAALGSVPRSLADPLMTNEVNITGFLNMLDSARLAGVRSFVYAASSSTYGDEPNLPKIENRIGRPLSPYAVTKYVNELYADVYARSYGFTATGLRYFNVFGPRQDPNGAYAAVIPKWAAAMIANKDININGDGETSRDFCYVANAVQANLRAALLCDEPGGCHQVFNVAIGDRTTLNDLFLTLKVSLGKLQVHYDRNPIYSKFRAGDVRHSQADITKAQEKLGYKPTHRIADGVNATIPWYIRNVVKAS